MSCTEKKIDERFEEHKAAPTSEKMRKWLSSGKVKIRLLEEISFTNRKEFEAVENEWIYGMNPKTSMNTKGVRTVVKKIFKWPPTLVQFERFEIRNCDKEKAFKIQWRESWRKKPSDFTLKTIML